jgi:hypothetical protein
MAAKHRAHQPKHQRQTSDLEKRVRRIERNYAKDALRIAANVAIVEIDIALAQHIQDEHGGWIQQRREAKGE